MYDRNRKMYDEPYAPADLEKLVAERRLGRGRLAQDSHKYSYLTQITKIMGLKVDSVLEIGPGEGIVSDYLRTQGIQYDTMDIEGASQSTYQSRLEDFDASELADAYDMVAAFQMLEHSPYETFRDNVKKMACMSKRYVFVSLPYHCNGFRISLRLGLGQRSKSRKLDMFLPSYAPNRRYREEYMQEFPWAVHYWEIGRKGFPLSKIIGDVESVGLRVREKFHGPNQYHFFILAEKPRDT